MNLLAKWYVISILVLSSYGCSKDKENPIRHSGELARRGHIDLYRHGAFKIPATEVRIIPPGGKTIDVAREFIGLKARDGFLMAIREAADSVYVVARGAEVSFRTAQNITTEGNELAARIRAATREEGILLISRSWAGAIGIIGDSWELSRDLILEMDEIGERFIAASEKASAVIDRQLRKAGLTMIKGSWVRGALMIDESLDRTRENLAEAKTNFVVGYALLPTRAAADMRAIGKAAAAANPVKIAREENEWRQEYSDYFADLVVRTGSEYTGSVKKSFSRAGRDLGRYEKTGLGLATLKALRWVLQGILYDAVLKPVVKVTIGAVGYLGVNGVAYPVMVVGKEVGHLTYVAVRLTWSTVKNVYYLIAPSAVLAAAGVFGLFDLTFSTAGAGAVVGTGTTAGALTVATGKTTSVVVKHAGYVGGKAVQYIGVPLTAAGIAVTGTTVGMVVGVSGTIPGGAMVVGGEVAGAGTQVAAHTAAGVVLTGGTALATGTALGRGAWYVVKAGLVPTGYTLGTGIVLGYGATSQLAAHTLLGLTDFAYLVLSLEGPRWVVYAIRGKTGMGKDLPPGAALDLNRMRDAGEEIHAVPVSPEEMHNVVEHLVQDFPVDTRMEEEDEEPSKGKKAGKKGRSKKK